MSISEERRTTGPEAYLASVLAGVGELAEALWSARTDEELVGVVGQVQALKAALAGVEAHAVAEAGARDPPKRRLHYASTADWITHVAGLRRGEAVGCSAAPTH